MTKIWKRYLLRFLCLLLIILSFHNLNNLFHSLVYAEGLDSDFHIWGWLIYFLILLLIFIVMIRIEKAVILAMLLWVMALGTALSVPSYVWPQEVWKLAHNKDRYEGLIARDQEAPKLVILERDEVALYPSGFNVTWFIYDESGQIALPSDARTETWKKRAPAELEVESDYCRLRTFKIRLHYFYVFAEC